jgi:hypothetical protein
MADPTQRALLQQESREFASFQDATVYLNQLRATAKVEVNPQLFN